MHCNNMYIFKMYNSKCNVAMILQFVCKIITNTMTMKLERIRLRTHIYNLCMLHTYYL